jgi:hypothetical protein
MSWQKRIRQEYGTEEHRQKSCVKKRVFHDVFLAIQACKSIERQNPGLYIRTYACGYCDGVHLSKCGRGLAIDIARSYLKQNLKHMSSFGWWDKCPKDIREGRIDDEIFYLKEMFRLNAWPRD